MQWDTSSFNMDMYIYIKKSEPKLIDSLLFGITNNIILIN